VLSSTKYHLRFMRMAIKGRNDTMTTMTTMATRITVAAGLAAGITMVALSSPAFAKNKYECMTDDGYGRKRSCSASYKAEHPNWRGSDDCYTDDGYGRKRSCSASYKAKHQK
jgi:tRNA U34 5-methylaminomethyl-2-thiouridine-forming methyltransferase MnmC